MRIVRLGRCAQTISGVGFPDSAQGSPDGDLPFLKVSDLANQANSGGVVTAANWVTTSQARTLGVRSVPPDSIVFPKVGAAMRGNARALTRVECAIDNNMMAVVPNDGEPRYWCYMLSTVDMALLDMGGTLPFVSDSAVRDLHVALPTVDEQRRIADFLDDQVARIDTALAARSRQRELAAETRKARLAALFSVGEDRKLRSLLKERPCYGVLVPRFVDSGGVSFIRVGDLGKLDAANTELPQIEPGQSAEYGRTVVEAGDLLVSVVGSIDKAAVVPVHRAGSNVARAVSRLRPVSESVACSLHAWMQTEAYLDQARLATGGDTAQPTLNMSDLSDFRIRLSDPDAVAVRAAEIVAEARVTDSALTRSIDLLNEYKRSLITAAVTGDFDVTTARTGVPA